MPEARNAEPRLQPRGSSQQGLAQYNERVVLHAVRQAGALPAAGIARATGLTAQTVSLITRRLTGQGLLLKGEPQRGQVGQPSLPLRLNPDGAFSVGLQVGRRSLNVLLVDLGGHVRTRWTDRYAQADPRTLLPLMAARLKDVRRALGSIDARAHRRVLGVGLAAPLNPGGWQDLLGLPRAVSERWQRTDLQAELAALSEWPVTGLKDTAAACVAELVAGRGREVKSYLYLFVDTFIGGGLVLDSHLHGGLRGNAGAIGSLPLRVASASGRAAAAPAQLLEVASLLSLERAYTRAGLDIGATTDARALAPPWRPHTRAWLDAAGAAVALAAQNAACLLDLEAVILDGSFSRELLAELLASTAKALPRYDWEGVAPPELQAGTVGGDARALGGALLPLHAAFSPDRGLFLKS
jgi:predicted NBD/HSP70 family sugar kinase